MNIFVLHENPRIAAQMHCERHILKMIIEHTQMMAAKLAEGVGVSPAEMFMDMSKRAGVLSKYM